MADGTIKTLVTERGFGFILPADDPGNGSDLFFHRSDLESGGKAVADGELRRQMTDLMARAVQEIQAGR